MLFESLRFREFADGFALLLERRPVLALSLVVDLIFKLGNAGQRRH